MQTIPVVTIQPTADKKPIHQQRDVRVLGFRRMRLIEQAHINVFGERVEAYGSELFDGGSIVVMKGETSGLSASVTLPAGQWKVQFRITDETAEVAWHVAITQASGALA